jgi:hypothetical protein
MFPVTFVTQSSWSADCVKSWPSAQQETSCKRVSDFPSRATSVSNRGLHSTTTELLIRHVETVALVLVFLREIL